jgi:hypothetical protein
MPRSFNEGGHRSAREERGQMMIMEARPYDPQRPADLGGELRGALRNRVSRLEDGLYLLAEVPVQTPFTLDVMFDRLEELAAGAERFAYIVDLSGVERPDAAAREKLRERVVRINSRLIHVGVVVGGNVVIRAVAKLAAFSVGFRSFSFHNSVDEAVEACRRALG